MFSSHGEGSEVCKLGVRGGLGEVFVFWTSEVGVDGEVIMFSIGEVGLGGELGGLRGEVNTGFMMSQFGKSFPLFSP